MRASAAKTVLVRSFAPVSGLSNALQAAIILIAALGGGSILGHRFGPWQGALAALGFVALLILVGAIRTQGELDKLAEAPKPHLKFVGTNYQDDVVWVTVPSGYFVLAASASASQVVHANETLLRFVRVKIANDPPPDVPGEDAHNVHARLAFDGLPEAISGRFTGTDLPPMKHPLTPDRNVAVELPANGRPISIDVAMQDPTDGATFAFNDDNFGFDRGRLPRHALAGKDISVTVYVRASNAPEIHASFQLHLGGKDDPVQLRTVDETEAR
jgi:hypothetical protein